MDKDLTIKLHKEYEHKKDSILNEYGEKDGFIIDGKLWWDYYKQLVDAALDKIQNNIFKEDDAAHFYKIFGFGPKLYGRSFLENGLDKIKNLFNFLADDNITPNQKIKEVVEDPESKNFTKGIGINFVTLFLTTYFPEKYVQWNAQTDGALKLLKAYPPRERGEKKSEFYSKVNDTCIKIGNIVQVTSMPQIDNFLFCLNRGYIGADMTVVGVSPQEVEEEPKKSRHDEMMYYLIKIGINKTYDVWIATNDKNKSCKGHKFADLCLKELPKFTQPSTLTIAQYIDVIWFKKNTSYPARFFEIENVTSVYSGLLRLNDVKIDYPLSKATIVIPKKRINTFETQIERRTFKYSELSDVCDFLTYEDLKKWFEAVNVDSRYV